MKTIVVYSSETGFTKRYAEWIAEDLGCECVDFKHFKSASCDADTIIFGGSLMASHIKDLDNFQKENQKNYIVFAVGLTEEDGTYINEIKRQNPLENVPLFYFQGGVNFSKLGFVKKKILKTVAKMSESVDYSNREFIKPLVDFVNQM